MTAVRRPPGFALSLIGLFALFAGFLLTGAPASRAAPVLRVADQKGFQRALLEVSHAIDGAPYQIEWSEFPAASPLLQALSAGAVDVGVAGDGPFLFAYGAGQNVRATLAVYPKGGGLTTAILVGPHSAIRKPADLAGHTVAVIRGSIGHSLLLRLAERGEIKLDRVKLVFLSPSQSKAALESGAVDAWATWEPYISLEVAQAGGRVIADGAGILSNYAFEVAYTGAIAGKRAELADFNHRLGRAMAWGARHPDAYAEIWSKQTGVPLDVSRKITALMAMQAQPIDDALIAEERSTLETYRRAATLPHDGPAIEAAFDRSFPP